MQTFLTGTRSMLFKIEAVPTIWFFATKLHQFLYPTYYSTKVLNHSKELKSLTIKKTFWKWYLLFLPLNTYYTSDTVQSNLYIAATAAKSLHSHPTLCDPIDSSPPGSPIPGILQARTLEWVAISSSKNLYITGSNKLLCGSSQCKIGFLTWYSLSMKSSLIKERSERKKRKHQNKWNKVMASVVLGSAFLAWLS